MAVSLNTNLDASDLVPVRASDDRNDSRDIEQFLREDGVGSYRKITLIRPASGETKGGVYYLFEDEQTAFWFKMKFG